MTIETDEEINRLREALVHLDIDCARAVERAQAAEAEVQRLTRLLEDAEPYFRLAREVINPIDSERPWHADSADWLVVFSFAGQSVTLGDLRRAALAQPQARDHD